MMGGEPVIAASSSVGSGTITGYTENGLPEVNGVIALWVVYPDGVIYDPYNCFMDETQ